jgi:hypothetical protein
MSEERLFAVTLLALLYVLARICRAPKSGDEDA